MRPKAASWGQRFFPERIQNGAAQRSASQSPKQGGLVHEPAACHVDEPGTSLHLAQAASVHELVSRAREWHCQDDEIRGGQQLRQLVMGEDLVESLGDGLAAIEPFRIRAGWR